MRQKFLAVLSWAEVKAASRADPGCQGLGHPLKPRQMQAEVWPGPSSPTTAPADLGQPHPAIPLLHCCWTCLAPRPPWFFFPQGPAPHLGCPQLPPYLPRGGPTPAAPSWASGCGYRLGPKAKPLWIGPTALPEAAPQPLLQVGAMVPGLTAVLEAKSDTMEPWWKLLPIFCPVTPLNPGAVGPGRGPGAAPTATAELKVINLIFPPGPCHLGGWPFCLHLCHLWGLLLPLSFILAPYPFPGSVTLSWPTAPAQAPVPAPKQNNKPNLKV